MTGGGMLRGPRARLVLASAAWLAVLAPSVAAPRPSTTPRQGIHEQQARALALTGATLAIRPGRIVEGGTLVVRDGRVVAAGAGVRVPDDAQVIDATGRWIFPGFVDPYTEYGLEHVGPLNAKRAEGTPPQYEGTRVGANGWNDAIHAERNWVESFRPDSKAARAWLERGFTVVQSGKMDGIFRGRAFVATLADGLPNELVLRAQASHFASFDRGSSQQSYPTSLMGAIALIRQSLLDADWYLLGQLAVQRGATAGLPELDRAIEALAMNDEPIVFEGGDVANLLRAAAIGDEFDVSWIHVASNTELPRVDEVAATEEPLILPLDWSTPPPVGDVEDERGVTLADLRRWERQPHHAAALERAGVTFAFTARGLVPDDDFFKRVRSAIRRGLSEETALAALTTVPAELCRVADRVGSLEAGREAHFFVADTNLLAGPGEVLSVWVSGRRALERFPVDQVDFRGTWRLALEDRQYELRIEGELDKPKGELRRDAEVLKLYGLSLDRSRLEFHAAPDAAEASPVVRFRLEAREGGQLVGRAWFPDGREVACDVRREPPAAGEPVAAAEEPDSGLELVSRVTFPDDAFGAEEPYAPQDVVVRGATLWLAPGAAGPQVADLLVRGGRIAAVKPSIDPPRGVRAIDGTGLHVTPGIVDEHSHIAIAGDVNEASHAITAEVRIGDVVDAEDVSIYRALAGGVTASQLLHGSANPIGGQAQVIKLRWGRRPEELKFDAAPPTIKFALGENVKQSNWGDVYRTRYPQSRMGVQALMRDAFAAARDYERQWSDYRALGKAERGRTVPPRFELQLETLLEVLHGKRLVHCHSYVQSEILSLMRLAEEAGFRIQTFTHILEGYKVAEEMAAHGASASSFSDWWAYKFEVYDAIPYNTCLMHERGVLVSVNSDSAEVTRRLNQEAAKSVHYCGMDESEALALVTLNPARQLGVDRRVGRLEPGLDADFVIWDGHPLSGYSKVVQTWIDGVPYFDVERDALLRAAARAERERLVTKALVALQASDKDLTKKKGDDKPPAEPDLR